MFCTKKYLQTILVFALTAIVFTVTPYVSSALEPETSPGVLPSATPVANPTAQSGNLPFFSKISAVEEDGKAVIKWEVSNPVNEKLSFYIYKGKDGSFSALPLNSYPIEEYTYTDSNVIIGADYSYMVKIVDSEGKPGIESPIASVSVKMVNEKVVTLKIGSPQITINGQQTAIDTQNTSVVPIIENGRTLVPIRKIVEAFNGIIDWYGPENKAVVYQDTTRVTLVIGNKSARISDMQYVTTNDTTRNGVIEVAPKIISSRTYLPLRFVAESLGIETGWDPATQTITLKKNIGAFNGIWEDEAGSPDMSRILFIRQVEGKVTGVLYTKTETNNMTPFFFNDEEIIPEDGTLKIYSSDTEQPNSVDVWMKAGEEDTLYAEYASNSASKTPIKLKRLSTLSKSGVK